MSGSAWKQKVIDNYLNESGSNRFVPAEFLVWLKDRPEHDCYEVFFGMSDQEAAQAYREELVRKWVSGLRVIVRSEGEDLRRVGSVEVREYSVPLVHSPVESRREGGGYVHTNPTDPEHLAELARQGAVALAAWIERFGGVAGLLGVGIEGVEAAKAALSIAGHRASDREAA